MAIGRISHSCPKAFESKTVPVNYLPLKNGNMPFLYFGNGKTLCVKLKELMLALGYSETNWSKNVASIIRRHGVKTNNTGTGRNCGHWISEKHAVELVRTLHKDDKFVTDLFAEARRRFPYSNQLVYAAESIEIPHAAKKSLKLTTVKAYARKSGVLKSLTHADLSKIGTEATKLAKAKSRTVVPVPDNAPGGKYIMVNSYDEDILEEALAAHVASMSAATV